jgi:hypothetical protein
MSQQLINLSPDLKQLRDEGYNIAVKGGYLVIHRIPYVNSNKEIKYGSLVSKLTLSNGTQTSKPETHVIHFEGEHPCDKEGNEIIQIKHASNPEKFDEGVLVNHSFSNKPPNGYDNYYLQVKRYAEIISAPAKSLNDCITEKPFDVVFDEDAENVFQYLDTNSSRANINMINAKFKGQRIAIIGVGGTGAYIVDLVAKTCVAEIHLFDGDEFLLHNAFRSPGAASNEVLENKPKKVDYYTSIYSNMHKHIKPHGYYVNEQTLDELNQMSYVFICIDRNATRKQVIEHLLKVKIPFIDVGLGVNTVDDFLIGTVRVTTGTEIKNEHLENRVPVGDNDNNDYGTNIQVADLNCLNAVMAVLKWKKMSGFYQDLENEHHSTYSINVAQLLNEETSAT